MDKDKINDVISIIDRMDIKDKLRLAIRMSESNYTNLKYNKPEMYKRFNNRLKEIDEDYKTTIINYSKYPIITFAMAKIMEISKEDQNQIALYLFNEI
ncbi:MAG: hypothetical protein ACLUF5_04395 [Clostridia bacterium]|jgi:hypothetical protein|nr:unknown [Clostridium sp. CAG:798]